MRTVRKRAVRLCGSFAGGLVGLLCCVVFASDLPYPKGRSTQTYKGRTFDLSIPDDLEAGKRYSLLFVVGRGGTGDFAHLQAHGFMVCSTKPRGGGASWATSEAKELHAVLDHLVDVLPLDPGRLHAVGRDDWQGFFPHVAFRKKGHRFRGVCFYKAVYRGGGLPSDAKKKLGVLLLGDDDKFEEEKIVEKLGKKVRTSEWRPELGFGSEYFRYWLTVMEGRFEPGEDLSFAWHTDVVKAKTLMAQRTGGFLYFYAKGDASKEAKALQNAVFFDPAVRAAGKKLVAVKLDRAENEKLFGDLGLTKTPAVVVLSEGFAPLKTFEGVIKARALAAAFRRARK